MRRLELFAWLPLRTRLKRLRPDDLEEAELVAPGVNGGRQGNGGGHAYMAKGTSREAAPFSTYGDSHCFAVTFSSFDRKIWDF